MDPKGQSQVKSPTNSGEVPPSPNPAQTNNNNPNEFSIFTRTWNLLNNIVDGKPEKLIIPKPITSGMTLNGTGPKTSSSTTGVDMGKAKLGSSSPPPSILKKPLTPLEYSGLRAVPVHKSTFSGTTELGIPTPFLPASTQKVQRPRSRSCDNEPGISRSTFSSSLMSITESEEDTKSLFGDDDPSTSTLSTESSFQRQGQMSQNPQEQIPHPFQPVANPPQLTQRMSPQQLTQMMCPSRWTPMMSSSPSQLPPMTPPQWSPILPPQQYNHQMSPSPQFKRMLVVDCPRPRPQRMDTSMQTDICGIDLNLNVRDPSAPRVIIRPLESTVSVCPSMIPVSAKIKTPSKTTGLSVLGATGTGGNGPGAGASTSTGTAGTGIRHRGRHLPLDRSWTKYISSKVDMNTVKSYTATSVKSLLKLTDSILTTVYTYPDDTFYTDEEIEESEDQMVVSLLKLVGVPQDIRSSIYDEALHNLSALQDISEGTIEVLGCFLDWCLNGDYGKDELRKKVRVFASITSDVDPDHEIWNRIERDVVIFSEAVGEAMKEGYVQGKVLARKCSETIISRLSELSIKSSALVLKKSQSNSSLSSQKDKDNKKLLDQNENKIGLETISEEGPSRPQTQDPSSKDKETNINVPPPQPKPGPSHSKRGQTPSPLRRPVGIDLGSSKSGSTSHNAKHGIRARARSRSPVPTIPRISTLDRQSKFHTPKKTLKKESPNPSKKDSKTSSSSGTTTTTELLENVTPPNYPDFSDEDDLLPKSESTTKSERSPGSLFSTGEEMLHHIRKMQSTDLHSPAAQDRVHEDPMSMPVISIPSSRTSEYSGFSLVNVLASAASTIVSGAQNAANFIPALYASPIDGQSRIESAASFHQAEPDPPNELLPKLQRVAETAGNLFFGIPLDDLVEEELARASATRQPTPKQASDLSELDEGQIMEFFNRTKSRPNTPHINKEHDFIKSKDQPTSSTSPGATKGHAEQEDSSTKPMTPITAGTSRCPDEEISPQQPQPQLRYRAKSPDSNDILGLLNEVYPAYPNKHESNSASTTPPYIVELASSEVLSDKSAFSSLRGSRSSSVSSLGIDNSGDEIRTSSNHTTTSFKVAIRQQTKTESRLHRDLCQLEQNVQDLHSEVLSGVGSTNTKEDVGVGTKVNVKVGPVTSSYSSVSLSRSPLARTSLSRIPVRKSMIQLNVTPSKVSNNNNPPTPAPKVQQSESPPVNNMSPKLSSTELRSPRSHTPSSSSSNRPSPRASSTPRRPSTSMADGYVSPYSQAHMNHSGNSSGAGTPVRVPSRTGPTKSSYREILQQKKEFLTGHQAPHPTFNLPMPSKGMMIGPGPSKGHRQPTIMGTTPSQRRTPLKEIGLGPASPTAGGKPQHLTPLRAFGPTHGHGPKTSQG